MRTILFISILNTMRIFSYSQNCQAHLNQNFIEKVINRSMPLPDNIECNNTGISVLKIYKETDSVKMMSLYYSCSDYDFSSSKYLSKALNKYCKDSIPDKCAIVVPIYFYYMPATGAL